MTASSVTDEHQAVPVPKAELEALRADAARYRWLRNDITDPDRLRAEMDAAIDVEIDAARMAQGFGEALDLTRNAVGRDGRGDPPGDQK